MSQSSYYNIILLVDIPRARARALGARIIEGLPNIIEDC